MGRLGPKALWGMGSQPAGLALSPAKPGQLPVRSIGFYYRFAPQSGREFSGCAPQSGRGLRPKVAVDKSPYHQGFPRKRGLSGFGDQGHPALHRRRAVAQRHAPVVQLEAGAPVLAQHDVEGLAEHSRELAGFGCNASRTGP